MKGYTGTEMFSRVPRRAGWRTATAFLGCAVCGAAAFHVTVDALHLRDDPVLARAIGGDATRSDTDRRNGIVASGVDARLTVAMLRRVAAEPGPSGEQARLMLLAIESAMR